LLGGYSLKEAAKQLSIGYSTANTYQTAIYKKLHVNSRAELLPSLSSINQSKMKLYGVCMDAKANVTRIDGSAYDTNESAILISTGHLLSVYGVGYTKGLLKTNR